MTPTLRLMAFIVDKGACATLDQLLEARADGTVETPGLRASANFQGPPGHQTLDLDIVTCGDTNGWRLRAVVEESDRALFEQRPAGAFHYCAVGWGHLVEELVPEGFDALLLFTIQVRANLPRS